MRPPARPLVTYALMRGASEPGSAPQTGARIASHARDRVTASAESDAVLDGLDGGTARQRVNSALRLALSLESQSNCVDGVQIRQVGARVGTSRGAGKQEAHSADGDGYDASDAGGSERDSGGVSMLHMEGGDSFDDCAAGFFASSSALHGADWGFVTSGQSTIGVADGSSGIRTGVATLDMEADRLTQQVEEDEEVCALLRSRGLSTAAFGMLLAYGASAAESDGVTSAKRQRTADQAAHSGSDLPAATAGSVDGTPAAGGEHTEQATSKAARVTISPAKPELAVGWRCEVFWKGKGDISDEWYSGVVSQHHAVRGFKIKYDDEEVKWEPVGHSCGGGRGSPQRLRWLSHSPEGDGTTGHPPKLDGLSEATEPANSTATSTAAMAAAGAKTPREMTAASAVSVTSVGSPTAESSSLPAIVEGLPTALELMRGMSDTTLDARMPQWKGACALGVRARDKHGTQENWTSRSGDGSSVEGGAGMDGGMAAQAECCRVFDQALADARELAGRGARPVALGQLQRAHRLLRRLNAPRWLLMRIRTSALVLEVRHHHCIKPGPRLTRIEPTRSHDHDRSERCP